MKDTGDPAFPVNGAALFPGMNLRDYFAAKALQAVLVNSTGTHGHDLALIQSTAAQLAYEFADAMLKERAK